MTSRAVVGIRAGRADESELLRGILLRSKGHWGYDDALLRRWAESYDFEALFGTHHVLVAEAGGEILGWAALIAPAGEAAVLDDLWVEPGWIGKGVGSRLFAAARDLAAALGAAEMEWEAEPNAIGFYERMGGRRVREATSEWGRPIEIMAVPVRRA